jgi:hypothetical protein
MTTDLQRVLFRWQDDDDELTDSATLRVLKDASLLTLIIEFVETGLEDLHWDVAD